MKIINKKIILGLSVIIGLLVISFLYPLYGPNDFNRFSFLYDGKGNIIGNPPLPPSMDHLLGTDRNGEDVLLMLIYGAKYTLLVAFGVTLLRVFFGGMLGVAFSLWFHRFLPILKDFLFVFKVVPPIIITLPLIRQGFGTENTIYNVLFYQTIILAIVGIPSVLNLTTDVIERLKDESYIQSSYLMGGNHFHVLKTHLMPYLKSYGLQIALQHLINTLGLIMFLGVFNVYIGGFSLGKVRGLDIPNSYTKEWAGLIGQNFWEFTRAPWIVLAPLFSYFFLLIFINIIKKEFEALMDANLLGFSFKKKRSKDKEIGKKYKIAKVSKSDFTLQKNNF